MIGTRLGPYVIEQELGSGGMGNVYAARVEGRAPDVDAGSRVALKVIHPHMMASPGFFKRFLREAEIGRSVRHGNVVRTLDADAVVVDGRHHHFLVMEYVHGQTLRDLLGEIGRIPEELCRHIGREVARGLGAIHAVGVVHRDMKPENVLITPDHAIKVMDLGVAKLMDEAVRLSRTGTFVGSLLYAAPEQLKGPDSPLDGRADLYALGMILYELSTGVQPLYCEDQSYSALMGRILNETPRRISELNPQLSPFFEEVVHNLLDKEHGQRFASAATLLDVLEEGETSGWWRERQRTLRTSTCQPLRRIRIPRETALWGRAPELATLREGYEAATRGEGRVVLLLGEAGIGKTRVVDEFVARLREEGADVNFLFGSNPPGGAATASAAFASAYRDHFGTDGLEQTLRGYLEETPLLVPPFAALLRGEGVPTNGVALDKDSLQTVFVHASRRLAAERTTIVLIDDLHFAPEDGRALFAALAMAVREHRILLVGTARRSLDEEWLASVVRLDHATERSLERLGPKDLADLLSEAFGSRRLADELGMQIARKSDGNPFFVFEILRGLREGGLISQRKDGSWASASRIADIEIPSSVRELVQARIARIDEESRDLLDVAACCGFEFDPLVVGEVLGLRRIPLLKRLAQIERSHRFVRASGVRYVFDHHQAHEALYESLSELLRREYHAAIAEVLEERSSGGPAEADGEEATAVCRHFLLGARGKQAARWISAALDHLEATHAYAAAAALADSALATRGALSGEPRVVALMRKAGWEHLLGRDDAERTSLDAASSEADALGDAALRARALNGIGRLQCMQAAYDDAESTLGDALELARAASTEAEIAGAEGTLGNVEYSRGRYAEALEHFEHQLELNRAAGDRHGEARALGSAGLVLAALGRTAEARERHERRLTLSRELGDVAGEAQCCSNLGLLHESLGELDRAQALYERALELAQQVGARRSEGVACANLANVLATRGRAIEARNLLEQRVRIAEEMGYRRGQARATLNLGIASADLGRWTDALEQYDAARALAEEIGDSQAVAILLVNVGMLLSALGDHDGSAHALQECRELCETMGAKFIEPYTWAAEALGAQRQGAADTAEELAARAVAMQRDLGNRAGVAEALTTLAAARADLGRLEDAGGSYREALALASELDLPGTRAVAETELAALAGDDGGGARQVLTELHDRLSASDRMRAHFALHRATDAPQDLAEAHRILAELVTYAPIDAEVAMTTQVRLHRAIRESWLAATGPDAETRIDPAM